MCFEWLTVYLCAFVWLCVCIQMFESPHHIHLMHPTKEEEKKIIHVHNKIYSTVDSAAIFYYTIMCYRIFRFIIVMVMLYVNNMDTFPTLNMHTIS